MCVCVCVHAFVCVCVVVVVSGGGGGGGAGGAAAAAAIFCLFVGLKFVTPELTLARCAAPSTGAQCTRASRRIAGW